MSSLILASASPRRSQLLHSIGAQFQVIPSKGEELHDPSIPPEEICVLNARLKANEVAVAHPTEIVLGCDTLVARNGKLYGKPRDIRQAREFLQELSGKTHRVISGVALLRVADGRSAEFADVTQVTFKPLSNETIEAYLQRVHVLDKAGAYAIQEHGEMIVNGIEGSLSNVIGLPLERLRNALLEFGITTSEPDKIELFPRSPHP
jgi:septum formation protein